MSDDKTYEGTMLLGVATDSQDADGEVIAEKPVPALTGETSKRCSQSFAATFSRCRRWSAR